MPFGNRQRGPAVFVGLIPNVDLRSFVREELNYLWKIFIRRTVHGGLAVGIHGVNVHTKVQENLRRNVLALGGDFALYMVGLAFASQATILPAFAEALGAPNIVIGAIPAATTLGWLLPSVFVAGHTAADASVRLDDPRAAPAWAYLAERRIPVSAQLRADGLGQLEAVLSRWPDAVVILDHCARPELDDGPPYAKARPLFALARHPNLHLKLTTHNVRESRQGRATPASFCRALVDRFGAHRIAWGSNFPASAGSLGELLQEALEATSSLSIEERAWIYSRAARSLLRPSGAVDASSRQCWRAKCLADMPAPAAW